MKCCFSYASVVQNILRRSRHTNIISGTDDENNDSDADLVIDTEKADPEKYDPSSPLDSEENTKEEAVSSTVDSTSDAQPITTAIAHSTTEVQSQAVQSTSQIKLFTDDHPDEEEEDDASEDGCPNFSIYSTESINLAKTTDLELLSENSQNNENKEVACSEVSSTPMCSENETKEEEKPEVKTEEAIQTYAVEVSKEVIKEASSKSVKTAGGLYSDEEDEVRIVLPKPFGIGDIRNMTEDISEEERSYTPCLDEKGAPYQEGLDGLDTEMISDEDRNDFDETQELKTASDGDALEINAKESELDFTKPEDYEEGEIVDKIKAKKLEETVKNEIKDNENNDESEVKKPKKKEKETEDDRNKENENQNKESSFKKLSKSNKERNYRDKDKARSRSRSKSKKRDRDSSRKDKKKEKRKEIERYDVRSIIAEKPRRLKDKFGRDIKHRSASRSSGSATPSRRSTSRGRRSHSRERRKRRGRSRERRTLSRSKSPERRRSRSRTKKRRRSSSRRRKSRDRSRVNKSRKSSRNRSRSLSPKRRRDWERRRYVYSVYDRFDMTSRGFANSEVMLLMLTI